MIQDEIIEMARQAQMPFYWRTGEITYLDKLEAFANLVVQYAKAEEREACANLCWKNQDDNAFVNAYNGKRIDLLCSELIRTRGKND